MLFKLFFFARVEKMHGVHSNIMQYLGNTKYSVSIFALGEACSPAGPQGQNAGGRLLVGHRLCCSQDPRAASKRRTSLNRWTLPAAQQRVNPLLCQHPASLWARGIKLQSEAK